MLKEPGKVGLSWGEAQTKTLQLTRFSDGFDCGLISWPGQKGSEGKVLKKKKSTIHPRIQHLFIH